MLSFTIQQIFYKVNLFNVILNFLDMLSKYNFIETNQQIMGFLIVLGSLVSLFSVGGFGLGGVLGLIEGAMGLAHKN
jgi:hypothetical protein